MTPPAGEPRLFTGPAGRALAVLAAANVLAYVDRVVVSTLVERLRADLWLTDARLGWLMTGFALASACALPLFGALARTRRRPRLLALGVAVLGAATVLSGAARGFATLLAARAAAGAGEAACGAVAPGLLADLAGRERRRRGGLVLLAAALAGVALGYALGGGVDRMLGWRAALVAAGAPGLLLALACLRLADPPRGAGARAWDPEGERGLAASWRRLRTNRPYALALGGAAAYAFAAAGLAFWMPAFLERARGVPRAVAAAQLAAIAVMTGLAGTFAGGVLAGALRRRLREAELWVAAGAALGAAPLALVALSTHHPGAYLVALVLAELLLFAAAAPLAAALANAVPVAERAGAIAVAVLAARLAGDVPAPALIGFVSDRSSLGRALLAVPAAILLAGVVWTWAAWRGERSGRAERGAAGGGAADQADTASS